VRRLIPKGIMDLHNLQAAEQDLFWGVVAASKWRVASVRFVSRRYRAEISAMCPKSKDFIFIKLNLLGSIPATDDQQPAPTTDDRPPTTDDHLNLPHSVRATNFI